MYMQRAPEKQKEIKAEKSKTKALRYFKVDPMLKIDETFYKQAKFICYWIFLEKKHAFTLQKTIKLSEHF